MTSVLPSHLTLTGWANKATWPPQLCQILAAGALRCESALHFHQGLRIIFVHPRILQVGGVVAKWIALCAVFTRVTIPSAATHPIVSHRRHAERGIRTPKPNKQSEQISRNRLAGRWENQCRSIHQRFASK